VAAWSELPRAQVTTNGGGAARRLAASEHASLSRSLAGLSALLDILQAAERARVEGGPDEQMGSFHTDGLIVAARQLVCEATHCLESGTP